MPPINEEGSSDAVVSAWRKKREERQRKRKHQSPEEQDMGAFVDDSFDAADKNETVGNDDDNDDAYYSIGKRKKMEEEALIPAHRRRKADSTSASATASTDAAGGALDSGDEDQNNPDGANTSNQEKVESLLESASALQQTLTSEQRAEKERKEEESRILREASKIQTNALMAASEVAQGVKYATPLPSTWTCPRFLLKQGPKAWEQTRKEWHMEVEGEDIPPPCKRFQDMKFPQPILDVLNKKGIKKPTPIQMQGLTVALAGRDMIGIAFTGSGKTLSFSLPLVQAALEEELRMPIVAGEGPIGIILAPSRELVRQTYDVVCEFCDAISRTPGYPQLRAQLVIGGESVRDQVATLQSEGIHCVVATPGRLRDILKRKSMSLDNCRYICLDEADRLLDLGFDEELAEIMNSFTHQRQTLLYSATFPKKFQDFARETLVQPIVVNVGRAGAANLDVIQEVEYVKDTVKIPYLLQCLQKTAPPVIIFCERKGDVDDIHEYLLLKGVQAASIHGGKEQEERNEAIAAYKGGRADVLVATDVAAKGLDFPQSVQHVINFDMPSEIENYVHRIGRTGRCGKTGVATTFINKSCDETTLLDLKHLLKEARQRIPPVLMMLDDPRDQNGGAGCSYCGGLGHTIVDCPKIDKNARQVASGRKDALVSAGGGYGGDW
jgi:ATP-dependent RNA helicase DDX41